MFTLPGYFSSVAKKVSNFVPETLILALLDFSGAGTIAFALLSRVNLNAKVKKGHISVLNSSISISSVSSGIIEI